MRHTHEMKAKAHKAKALSLDTKHKALSLDTKQKALRLDTH